MNPTEIFDSLDQIASDPFDSGEFPFAFAEATDNAKATISKLRNGTTNKSDIAGGVLLGRKFHYAPATRGNVEVVLDRLRTSRRSVSVKPAILLTTDGDEVAAEHMQSGDTLHCRFDQIGDKFGFFLPAAGKERYEAAEENEMDVKATGKLAKLYDALIKANPEWGDSAHRHAMNQLLMRLIFCLFSEKVGIFPEGQLSRLLFTHAGDRGEEAREMIVAAFRAMNLPKGVRPGLPAWTAELEYVNGGLFAGEIDAPKFDPIAFRYLRDAARLNWREINPDIFGSMIQSVADPKQRSELGMHYTSVPNIMKVLGPLFLDDLDADISKAWEKPRALQRVIDRMASIRVFDPACGSGNFLVVAYRELRARETRIWARIAEIEGRAQTLMFSAIPITHFYGIEITDFAAETAKLALFIAEYQANAKFGETFGQMPASLPLKEAARIVCGNSLRIDWETVCPVPGSGETVFIAGNPPFLGSRNQSPTQKKDHLAVLGKHITSAASLDMVAAWYFKAAEYIRGRSAEFALVSTNSLCQGQSVASLWPAIFDDGLEIGFAHTSFPWRNNASQQATVTCIIVGVRNKDQRKKRIFHDGVESLTSNISAYLGNMQNVVVKAERASLFGLPTMDYGNYPGDGTHLTLSAHERDCLLEAHPEAAEFVRPVFGAKEFLKGLARFCLWISDNRKDEALSIPFIHARAEQVRRVRLESRDPGYNKIASTPYRYRDMRVAETHTILIPTVSSERREYVPCDVQGAPAVTTNQAFVILDGPDWCFALLSSRLHFVWITTVCGKLESRLRYSNTLGWNTFPAPAFTEAQKEQLSASARRILKTRYEHFPKTIAELYDPNKMPDDLRAVHKTNDDLLDGMYISRPFRNDTERLERLFKLYAARVKKEAD